MDARDNLLLAALPEAERAALLALAHPQKLKLGQVLYEQDAPVDDVYFFGSGAASLLVEMADGRALEPAIIGREGMLGFPIGLGDNRSRWRSMMQLPGEALVLRRDDLSAHIRKPGNLAALLTHYAGLLVTFVAQSAACTQFHVLEQRSARWLLIMHDRAQTDEIAMTREHLAYMLGAQRPSVTLVLDELSQRGLIALSRGRIAILDRGGLEAAACECYERVEGDYRELVRVAHGVSIGQGGLYSPGEQAKPEGEEPSTKVREAPPS